MRKSWSSFSGREKVYRAGLPPLDVEGKTIIVVDDGIATGSTRLAAVFSVATFAVPKRASWAPQLLSLRRICLSPRSNVKPMRVVAVMISQPHLRHRRARMKSSPRHFPTTKLRALLAAQAACRPTRRIMTPDTSTEFPETNPLGFKIERILVPLDFSPASLQALDYAVWLAKQFRAAIHLVHVYPPDEASSGQAQDISSSRQPRRSNGLMRN